MFASRYPILLGSGSPRRREFLENLGLRLVVCPPDVDETVLANEAPEAYLERIAQAKLERVLEIAQKPEFAVAIVADTTVVLDGILGKPEGPAESYAMIRRLAGGTHRVLTRYALATPLGVKRARTVGAEVVFRSMTEAEIVAYVRSGEGLDKAGAYAVQGIGAAFVERIVGSYSTVVGLPLAELTRDLLDLGVIFPLSGETHP